MTSSRQHTAFRVERADDNLITRFDGRHGRDLSGLHLSGSLRNTVAGYFICGLRGLQRPGGER